MNFVILKPILIFLAFSFLFCCFSLENSNIDNNNETMRILSSQNFSNIYQKKFNYQVILNRNNKFQDTLSITSSKVFFLCEDECNLPIWNSMISLEDSYFGLEKIFFNISHNEIPNFNYLFHLTKNSLLSLKVRFYFLLFIIFLN